MLTRMRRYPFTSMILVGAVWLGALVGGTQLTPGHVPALHNGSPLVASWEDGSARYADGASFDPDTRTFDVSVYVGEDPDPATDAYNLALGQAFATAGYVGVAGDGCECVDVPEGTTVDVLGYGPMTVES